VKRARRSVRFAVGCLAAVLVLAVPAAAGGVTITGFVSLAQAAAGNGWAVHPDQTAGGSERFVEGPLTPPSGRGSLELSVAATSDRALVFTVPKPGARAHAPGAPGPFNPTPWGSLTGSSFSTFTANTAAPASSIPVLKFVGYHVFNAANPLQSTGFTTLNFEGSNQGSVTPDQWETWTLGPTSRVWQSNTTGGFCQIAAPCTLTEFVVQYPNGAWGQIQIGLGSGAAAGAVGYADNVQVPDGTTTFTYDFETPSPSTATIVPLAPHIQGRVAIVLDASPDAVGPTVFTIAFSGSIAVSPAPVTLAAGQGVAALFDLPFGTTNVEVQVQGVTIASAAITIQPLPPPTTEPPTTSGPAGTIPATGSPSGKGPMLALGLGLLTIGSGLFLIARQWRKAA
jgi:hypothetical protein